MLAGLLQSITGNKDKCIAPDNLHYLREYLLVFVVKADSHFYHRGQKAKREGIEENL